MVWGGQGLWGLPLGGMGLFGVRQILYNYMVELVT